MKSFIIALSLLFLMITATVLNCIYLEKITNNLLDLEKQFPEKAEDGKSSPAAAIDRAKELWEEAFPKIQIGANMRYLNAVSTALNHLCDHYENGSVADYIAARTQFIEAIKTLKHSDSLSIGNII